MWVVERCSASCLLTSLWRPGTRGSSSRRVRATASGVGGEGLEHDLSVANYDRVGREGKPGLGFPDDVRQFAGNLLATLPKITVDSEISDS